jgi:hypothetical protein
MAYIHKRPPIIYTDTNTPQQTAILRLLAHARHYAAADVDFVASLNLVQPQLTRAEAARLAVLVREVLGDVALAGAVESDYVE